MTTCGQSKKARLAQIDDQDLLKTRQCDRPPLYEFAAAFSDAADFLRLRLTKRQDHPEAEARICVCREVVQAPR
jgi:hypothetical protein